MGTQPQPNIVFILCDNVGWVISGVNLASDPGELYNLMATKMDMGWMLAVVLKFVADFQKSIAKYPNIKTGEEFNGY